MKKLLVVFFISVVLNTFIFPSSEGDFIHNYLERTRTCRNGTITDKIGDTSFLTGKENVRTAEFQEPWLNI